MSSALPYRPNVGIALFDARGLTLIAKRIGDDGPETLAPGCAWQMPQGGIDPDENVEQAARRELFEETGVRRASVLGVHPEWLTYDFPPYDGPPHRLAAFRGQRQRWFAMRFEGDDGEIDLAPAAAGAEPEFSEWRWERLERLPALVVPYKRALYDNVARAFARFAAPA
ncbi:RNA pyrophosphohydrolase [Methylopila henanensis]